MSNKDSHINHRHDLFFRKAMENPIVAREFIETHVPADIKDLIDLSSLKLQKDTFVEKNLKQSACDVLFSAKIDGEDGFLFLLLEHQSKPDYWMGLRLMKYMLSICSRYLVQNPKAKKLPLVYPLVLFNGKQRYDAPRNLWDLFKNSEQAKKLWNNDHLVINVHDIPDEELKQRAWSGILEFFLKHNHKRNLMQAWEQIQELIPKLIKVKSVGLNYLELILHYSLTAVEKNDKIRLETMLRSYLNDEEEKNIMTSLARHWMNEGIEKGIEKERNKTALEMLRYNADTNFISKVTGLSKAQIEQLKDKLQTSLIG